MEHGLNPLSSAGTDGASGDPDGDGLSNYEEWTLGADPMQFDGVILLGPNDLYDGGMLRLFGPGQGVQYRSLSTTRAKCGFEEFVQSEPPKRKFYNKSTMNDEYSYGWYGINAYNDHYITEGHYTAINVSDPLSCTQACNSSGSRTSDAFYELAGSGWPCSQHTHYEENWNDLPCGSEIIVHGTYRHPWDCVVENVQYSYNIGPFVPSGVTPTNPVYLEVSDDFSETEEEQNVVSYWHDFWSETLSEEYTTGQLLANALADLGRCDSLANLPWGEGRTWGGACGTNAAATAAFRDLSEDETQVALTTIGYRFRVANLQAGQIYRLNWVELFTPEGSTTSTVLRTRTATLRGTGGVQYIEDSRYVIEPPQTDGTVEPVPLKVEVVSVDATSDISPVKINYQLLPSGISLPSVTFTAPGITETRANVGGNFFFTYNQADLPEGNSTIQLAHLGNNTDLAVTRTSTGQGPANELVIATVLWEENGSAGYINIPITHNIMAEGYDRITYMGAPTLPGSYTLWVGGSSVKVETSPDYPIASINEKHKYHDSGGTYAEQFMTPDTGPTIPEATEYRKYFDSMDDRYFRPGLGLTGIARLDVVAFDDGGQTVFPLVLSNEEVDQTLE